MCESNRIIEFIDRRFGKYDANWLNGNCYYFAIVLVNRFPELEIYYEPIDGHFLAGDGLGHYYDWTGLKDITYQRPQLFKEIRKEDELLYNRLIRDCIL